MNISNTYRQFLACFLAGLVCMVFTMQGLHHVIGHHHHESHACGENDVHVHAQEHSHSSCNICFFNFDSAETIGFELTKSKLTIKFVNNYNIPQSYSLQQLRQSCLRGPPTV